MTRANPFDLVRALGGLGVELRSTTDDPDGGLAKRPKRLFGRLARQGFEIEQIGLQTAALQRYGFSPDIVCDIGVDFGTPELYKAFPNSKFMLIDPVAESEAKVAGWTGKIDYDFHCCAVGAKKGEIRLNVPSTDAKTRHSRASINDFEDGYASVFASIEHRQVPLKRLDDLTKGLKGRFGIKIDTEGAELDVIKGATRTLKQTEFVIAEASVRMRYKNGYRFSEIVTAMAENGFEILEFLRPIRPNAADCDVLFARFDSGRFAL